MRENDIEKFRRTVATTLVLLPLARLSAQEDDEDDFVLGQRESPIKYIEEEDPDMLFDGFSFSMRRYMNELVNLIILVIIIAVVNHFTSKRNRTGCIFFTILIFVVWYVYRRYI